MKFKRGDIIQFMEKDFPPGKTIDDWILSDLLRLVVLVKDDWYYFKTDGPDKDGSPYKNALTVAFADLFFEKIGEFKHV